MVSPVVTIIHYVTFKAELSPVVSPSTMVLDMVCDKGLDMVLRTTRQTIYSWVVGCLGAWVGGGG